MITAHATSHKSGARDTVVATIGVVPMTSVAPSCPKIGTRLQQAGQGDLGDAERRGQTHADADRTTAAAVGCKPVEYPSTRRPVGVSDNERSDRQNEYQVVVDGQAGKSVAVASSTMPTMTGGMRRPEPARRRRRGPGRHTRSAIADQRGSRPVFCRPFGRP